MPDPSAPLVAAALHRQAAGRSAAESALVCDTAALETLGAPAANILLPENRAHINAFVGPAVIVLSVAWP